MLAVNQSSRFRNRLLMSSTRFVYAAGAANEKSRHAPEFIVCGVEFALACKRPEFLRISSSRASASARLSSRLLDGWYGDWYVIADDFGRRRHRSAGKNGKLG